MDDEKLVKVINREFAESMGAPDGEISKQRVLAWERYNREPLGDEIEGGSHVVTSEVSDVVDGIMPSLLRLFTTAENVCSFDAVGPEDEALAAQEGDYVNHVFFKENDSFLILFFWMFDALLQKNGIVMAWWDESEEVTTEKYTNLTEESLPDLLDDEELEPVSRDEREVEVTDPLTGLKVAETRYDLEFRRVSKSGRVTVENVPPDEYRISSDARSPNPKRPRMRGRERLMSRSDMIDMGFDPDQVNELKSVAHEGDEQEQKQVTTDENKDGRSDDHSQDLIRVREAYIRVDYDGDGRAELRQVFTGAGKLLVWADSKEPANTPVDRDPFHVITPHPLPHKHFGEATAEKVIDVMETSTTLLRQVLMNLYHTNNPGHAVDERALGENTMDDLLTTRVGRTVRVDGDPNASLAPIAIPFTASATFPMLEYFDKVKRDRTGVSSDSEGLSPDSLKNIQTSVLAQSVDMSKMKIEAIARIFAETGFKTLFLHIHELLIKHQDKEKVVKLRNQWTPVNPTEWLTRQNMTVNIGLGIGTREQNLLHLDAIWAKQTEMASGGGMNLTVTPKNFYNTAAEIVKNANLKDPNMFFSDPGQQLAPPPADEQQEFEKQQAELEARRQQLDSDRNELNHRKLELAAMEAEAKHNREMIKLEEGREERIANYELEIERLNNELIAMQDKALQSDEEFDLKKRKTEAEIDNIDANTLATLEDS